MYSTAYVYRNAPGFVRERTAQLSGEGACVSKAWTKVGMALNCVSTYTPIEIYSIMTTGPMDHPKAIRY